LRGFPFSKEAEEFIRSHKKVFVIEQNRDAQMKSLIMTELLIDAGKLVSVLNYDGLPITANHVTAEITANLSLSQKIHS
jgi:2-oxoglutarate ferredoxin oxidoreductase subunit alpha